MDQLKVNSEDLETDIGEELERLLPSEYDKELVSNFIKISIIGILAAQAMIRLFAYRMPLEVDIFTLALIFITVIFIAYKSFQFANIDRVAKQLNNAKQLTYFLRGFVSETERVWLDLSLQELYQVDKSYLDIFWVSSIECENIDNLKLEYYINKLQTNRKQIKEKLQKLKSNNQEKYDFIKVSIEDYANKLDLISLLSSFGFKLEDALQDPLSSRFIENFLDARQHFAWLSKIVHGEMNPRKPPQSPRDIFYIFCKYISLDFESGYMGYMRDEVGEFVEIYENDHQRLAENNIQVEELEYNENTQSTSSVEGVSII